MKTSYALVPTTDEDAAMLDLETPVATIEDTFDDLADQVSVYVTLRVTRVVSRVMVTMYVIMLLIAVIVVLPRIGGNVRPYQRYGGTSMWRETDCMLATYADMTNPHDHSDEETIAHLKRALKCHQDGHVASIDYIMVSMFMFPAAWFATVFALSFDMGCWKARIGARRMLVDM